MQAKMIEERIHWRIFQRWEKRTENVVGLHLELYVATEMRSSEDII